jgi:hypothetical protein
MGSKLLPLQENSRRLQKQWTVAASGCSVSRMRKCFLALLFLATPLQAQERPSAYDALRVVGSKFGRESVNHIISVNGVDGDPQPATWKILFEDPRARGGVREVEVADGRVTSERAPLRSVTGSSEGATIKTTRLNLDSSGAFQVANHTADKSNTRFDTASYTLRTDERGDPVWIVTLRSTSGRPVGTIHINCNRGNVVRTEGMFAGATMDDVQTDQDVPPQDGNEGGIINTTKARVRETFRRAQDEARDMFDRTKRSFVDFINRM